MKNLNTGRVELVCTELTILNRAETPPFPLDEYQHIGEDTRFKAPFTSICVDQRCSVILKFVQI